MIRLRRSVLFMPGSNARALEKARSLPADAIVLDIEDSVAPDEKARAREQILSELTKGGFDRRECIIRTNHLQSAWWHDDSAMAAKAKPDAILVPKIKGPEDVIAIQARLDGLGADPSVKIWIMIETPLALLQIKEIAQTKKAATRLDVFALGPNDLSLETKIRMKPGRAEMVPLFLDCIIAARSYGIEVLDGPYSDFKDIEGYEKECEQARDLGFDGKTLIHPSQIEAANAAFTPAAEDVKAARQILDAFTRPENADKGAINLNGKMVERLHAEMARRTIEMADAITGLKTTQATFRSK